jgi:D-alanyl-D-alanine carboxypeptidase/D-alanyl-D-alanine-endopeptidase (penicillin-binding protein 4)
VRSSFLLSTRIGALLLALAVSASPLPATSRPSATKAKVVPTLEAALAQAALRPPSKKDGVSIFVADLETGEKVFEKNPSTPETIASVTKLFSTAAALHYLGPAYKFQTTFWRRGEIKEGNLMAPSWSSGEGTRTFQEGSTTTTPSRSSTSGSWACARPGFSA